MATVQLTQSAARALRELMSDGELPATARSRVALRLRQLERFPESGRRVDDPAFDGARVIGGPWWLVLVYVYDAPSGLVTVTAALDGRTARAPRS